MNCTPPYVTDKDSEWIIVLKMTFYIHLIKIWDNNQLLIHQSINIQQSIKAAVGGNEFLCT